MKFKDVEVGQSFIVWGVAHTKVAGLPIRGAKDYQECPDCQEPLATWVNAIVDSSEVRCHFCPEQEVGKENE